MPNDPRFDEYLDMIANQYGQIQPAEGGEFEVLPVGQYQVKVLHVEGKVSKNNNPMLEWTFEVLSPVALKGRRIWKTSMLTAQGIPWLMKDLKTLRMPWWNDSAAMKSRLGELKGLILEVGHTGRTDQATGRPQVDDKGRERRDTYINKLLLGGESSAPAPDAPPSSEEIPF